jgi:hypothetical protein
VNTSSASHCAIRTDDTLACWGTSFDRGVTTPPPGKFAHVLSAWSSACALDFRGNLVCWGSEVRPTQD